MPSEFTPNRALLNPKFDGYKLDPLEHSSVLTSFPLTYPLSQIAPSARSPLTFQEVQSRIRHNHLTVGPDGSAAVYVDREMRVVRVSLDATLEPTYDVLYELPRPIQSSEADADAPHKEYPSSAFVDARTLFVADGTGLLYLLRLPAEGEGQGQGQGAAELVNTYELSIPEEYHSAVSSVPFRVHAAVCTDDEGTRCSVLLSSKHYHTSSSSASASTKTAATRPAPQFDVWAVTINLDADSIAQDQPVKLDIAWHKRGSNVPAYVSYVPSAQSFLLLGSSPYRPLDAPTPVGYEPSADEIAPVPRADEVLDNTAGGKDAVLPKPPPPYSWTQTSDSVTVAFPLPSTTPTRAIKVAFSATTLSVFVSRAAEDSELQVQVPLPKYTMQKLWDGIHPASSLWTFDRDAEHSFGLLTLHLDKVHEGTRWTQLFAPSSSSDAAAPEEVPETLDPSELAHIRDALEKYTAALQSGEDASGLGLGRGVPSLAEGEMDDEVDAEMGERLVVTWARVLDGAVPPQEGQGTGEEETLSVLSTPLQGDEAGVSVVAKTGLDGVVYTLSSPPTTSTEKAAWTHTSTFCVLAFVLASKRDTRFVHHVLSPSTTGEKSGAVLAFESGARGMGCNVYIYRAPSRPHAPSAKQCILKLNDGTGGPLLGVGLARAGGKDGLEGRKVVLCLCEKELVVMHDVL